MRWFLLLVTATAWGTPMDLIYTVAGSGGLADPFPGISDQSFWYADYMRFNPGEGLPSPRASTTFPMQYGFDPLIRTASPSPPLTGFKGSTLLSSPFTLSDEETLSFNILQFFNKDPYFDFGFALLLQDDALRAILYNSSVNGLPTVSNALHQLTPTSPGVTSVDNIQPHIGLWNGINYSDGFGGLGDVAVGAGGACCGATVKYPPLPVETRGWFSPGGGLYQLLVGTGSFGNSSFSSDSVIVVKSVERVALPEPEGDGLATMVLGLAAVALACRYAKTLRS